jgi:hypothetical protein
LPDGRPAGHLLLLADRPEEAVAMLTAATVALPHDGLVHACLGEALWRCSRRQPALAAYVHACLIGREAVDEAAVTCTPVHDLLDRAAELELPGAATAWMPVLADLDGEASLIALAVGPAAGGPAAGEVARAPALVSAPAVGWRSSRGGEDGAQARHAAPRAAAP